MEINDLVKEFRENGYLVIRNAFSKEEVAKLKKESDLAAKEQRVEDLSQTVAGGAIDIEPLKEKLTKEINFDSNDNFDEDLVKASGVAQTLPKYNPDNFDEDLVKASGVAQTLPKYNPDKIDEDLVKASGVAQTLPKYNPVKNQISEKRNLVTQGMNELWRYNKNMENFILNKKILKVINRLLGDEVKLLSDTIIHKPAYHGAASPLHRDSPFWKGITPHTQISCWIPFQDVNEKNGCLGYIPGSHLDSKIETQPERLMSEDLSLNDDYKEKIEYIPINEGDCLIHHGLTLHGTGPNSTNNNRTSYVVHFMDGNSESIGDEPFKNVNECPYVIKNGNLLEYISVT